MHSSAPPMQFSQVCSSWRRIALSYAQIWTALDVDLETPTSALHVVDLFLQRSNQRPLKLSLHGLVRNPTSLEKDSWRPLLSSFGRCYSLTLGRDLSHEEFPGLQISFPLLTEYDSKMCVSRNTGTTVLSLVCQALSEAPNLCEVSTCAMIPVLPYSQLTSFTFYHIYANESDWVFQKLPLCTRLDSLHIWDLEDISVELPQIKLPSVKNLTVGVSGSHLEIFNHLDAEYIHSILHALSLPNLAMLGVAFTTDDEEWPQVLLAFLSRASSSLTKLCLAILTTREGVVNAPKFSQVIEAVPKVASFSLHLEGCAGTDTTRMAVDLFTSLSSESCCLVPQLESISLTAPRVDSRLLQLLQAAIIDAAERRQPGVWDHAGDGTSRASLRSIVVLCASLSNDPVLSRAFLERVQELRNNGVDIEHFGRQEDTV